MYNIIHSEDLTLDRFHVIKHQVEKEGQVVNYSYITIRHGICVIPLLPTGEILIQKEYRHPIRSWQYEFPCGAIDDGEEPEHTAIREVKEETGCEVKTIRSLGVVYPSFGATDETIHLFVAEIIVPEDVDINDDSDTHGRELLEEIKMEAVTEAQLDQLVASGEFSHGAGLAAIARWKLCRD